MAFPRSFGQICSEFPWHYCLFSGLKIAHPWGLTKYRKGPQRTAREPNRGLQRIAGDSKGLQSNTGPVCIKFWQHWVSIPKQQGVRDFAEICTDYCNLLAFVDKYISKLAFGRQNTVRSLIVSSAQVICVQQMSPPKLFVHQRSSKLVNAVIRGAGHLWRRSSAAPVTSDGGRRSSAAPVTSDGRRRSSMAPVSNDGRSGPSPAKHGPAVSPARDLTFCRLSFGRLVTSVIANY